MKKNTWNVRHLLDESFVPSAQRTSILYCRLSDFRWQWHDESRWLLFLKKDDFIKIFSVVVGCTDRWMFIQKHFLPIVEENRKAGEWFTMISPLCSRMIFRVGALNTGWLITENYLSFLNVHSKKNVYICT